MAVQSPRRPGVPAPTHRCRRCGWPLATITATSVEQWRQRQCVMRLVLVSGVAVVDLACQQERCREPHTFTVRAG